VDWHSFRRAFATSLAEAGVNEQRAMLLTSHSDSKVHARYVQETQAMQVIPEGLSLFYLPHFGREKSPR